MNVTRRMLGDLVVGDVVKATNGHRQWMEIVEIGDVRGTHALDSGDDLSAHRQAKIRYTGGKDAGTQVHIALYHVPSGWVVQQTTDIKVKVVQTVTVSTDFRRAINRHYGKPGLATRDEVRDWIISYGDSMNENLSTQEDAARERGEL